MPFERQKNLSFRQQNLKRAKRKKSEKVLQPFPILRENGKKEKKAPEKQKSTSRKSGKRIDKLSFLKTDKMTDLLITPSVQNLKNTTDKMTQMLITQAQKSK